LVNILGNPEGVHTHPSAVVNAGPTPYLDRADFTAWFTHLSPPLRKLIGAQPVFVFVGVVVSVVLWALQVPTTLVYNSVISLCIGNVLLAVLEYACRWYDNLNPPWNCVVYLPCWEQSAFLGPCWLPARIVG
jgi:hypothetical protein